VPVIQMITVNNDVICKKVPYKLWKDTYCAHELQKQTFVDSCAVLIIY